MDDSDEELYITQNSFTSTKVTESNAISGNDVDTEETSDRFLDDVEIEEQVQQSIPLATCYKDGWHVRAFKAWHANGVNMEQSDNSTNFTLS